MLPRSSPPASAESSRDSRLAPAPSTPPPGGGPRPSVWASAPRALRMWGRRQWLTALLVTLGVGLLIGVSTVLIPNSWFSREIATEPWDYPVWVAVSVLSGLLAGTYVQPAATATGGAASGGAGGPSTARQRVTRSAATPLTSTAGASGASADVHSVPPGADEGPSGVAEGRPGVDDGSSGVGDGSSGVGDGPPSEDGRGTDRPARLGAVGAVLGWFAVGCPVCNKIALLALGYTGALQWFAPAQPVLAALAIGLSTVALLVRLRGQVWCPTGRPAKSADRSFVGA